MKTKKHIKTYNASPLKNIDKNKKDKKFTIKNFKIIDNSSSINIIKSSNRDIIREFNNNKKKKTIVGNESKIGKLRKKFKRKLPLHKTEKRYESHININKTKNFTYLPTQDIQKNKGEVSGVQDEDEKIKNLK